MALAVTISIVDNGQFLSYVYGTIAASGSYATGGDTLDFSKFDQIKSGQLPLQVSIFGQKASGNTGWWYNFVPGTTQANSKMQVFGGSASSGTSHQELTNSTAYSAASPRIDTDTIQFCAIFQRI